jgi:transposase
MACRVTPDPTVRQAHGIMERKEFETMTVDLLAWSDWLVEAGTRHGAMENMREDSKPVSDILEGNSTVFLVNPSHATQVLGRKTDRAEARWLAARMRDGVLQARFIPPMEQRALRELTCDRTTVVQEWNREIIRVQGVLERANSKLASGASDIMGEAGDLGRVARRAGRSRHDGGVGQGAPAPHEPSVGAGPDWARAGPSPAAARAAVGPYRLPG